MESSGSADVQAVSLALDTAWILLGAVMVFFMQAGFAMLEVGSVSIKNTKNILVKNIGDSAMGAIGWWLLGNGLAFGESSGGFIGTTGFALKSEDLYGSDSGEFLPLGYAQWLFQWAFAASATTIVSGAMAERATFGAYVVHSFLITTFIYPVVAHWAWSAEGWASPWLVDEDDLLFGCGVIDFAGSGVVHMTGGMAALVGIFILGPRAGRFNEDGTSNTMPQQSAVLQTLGSFMLWWGWLGFNAASVSSFVAMPAVAAKVMGVTVIGASAGGIASLLLFKLKYGYWDVGNATNGILAGLVSITAGSGTFEPEGAFVVGLIGGLVYFLSSNFLLDDVVNAAPVHLFGGMWGLVAAGIFSSKFSYSAAYFEGDRSDKCAGVLYGGSGRSLAANLVFLIAVLAWVGLTALVLFVVTKLTIGIRVSKQQEIAGMDDSKHGGQTYPELLPGIKSMDRAGGSYGGKVYEGCGGDLWLFLFCAEPQLQLLCVLSFKGSSPLGNGRIITRDHILCIVTPSLHGRLAPSSRSPPAFLCSEMSEPPLVRAVMAGCPATVLALLDSSSRSRGDALSLDMGRARDASLLVAAYTGHRHIASTLLMQGADKDAVNGLGDTLITAASHGRLDVVRTLLAVGADLNKGSTRDGCTALHAAVLRGHGTVVACLLDRGAGKDTLNDDAYNGKLDVVEFLLAAGADANARGNADGCSALHIAVDKGDYGIVSALLLHSSEVETDALDFRGQTPLISAAGVGLLCVVQALVTAGSDVNLRSTDGASPLHFTAFHGHVDVASVLLAEGADKDALDARGYSSLIWAVGGGHVPVVEALLAPGVDVNSRGLHSGCAALRVAASEGHAAMVTTILRSGADKDALDAKGNTALSHAANRGLNLRETAGGHRGASSSSELLVANDHGGRASAHHHSGGGGVPSASTGHLATVQILIAAGAELRARREDDGATALHAASGQGLRDVVLALLQGGGGKDERDRKGESPLIWAARRGHRAVVEILKAAGADLERGADKDVVDKNGETALMKSAAKGHLGVVSTLLAGAADCSICNTYRASPLHAAASRGYRTIVSLLLRAGANKDASEDHEATPLKWAAGRGRRAIVEVLLMAGADSSIRSSSRFGGAPIHAAAYEGHVGVVSALLLGGGDVDLVDNTGRTSLIWAVRRGHVEVAEALLEAGADVSTRDHYGRTPLHWVCRNQRDGLCAAVSLLLVRGADETALDAEGNTPQSSVGLTTEHGESRCSEGFEIERVLVVLAGAPAERAWGHRRWQIMLRWHTSKIGTNTAGDFDDGDGGGRSRKVVKKTTRATRNTRITAGGRYGGNGLGEMVAELVTSVPEQQVFRAVVGYL
eukprot:g2217.t1